MRSDRAEAIDFDFELKIDCDVVAAGIQDTCTFPPGTTPIAADAVLTNTTGAPANIAAFNLNFLNNNQPLANPVVPASCLPPGTQCNPDFNEGIGGTGWSCAGPNPDPDLLPGDPQNSLSFISCNNASDSFNSTLADGASVPVARVTFTVTGTGSLTFGLSVVNVTDDLGAEILSCGAGGAPAPAAGDTGDCAGAGVTVGASQPPTSTNTSTATNTSVPPTNTNTPTATNTTVPATNTNTPTATNTTVPPTNTNTPTATNTTAPATQTFTPTPTNTSIVPTATDTVGPPPTETNTPLPTATETEVPTATNTLVPTETNTPQPTATETEVPTATNTLVPGEDTFTPEPTATETEVPPTATATNTSVPTATNTTAPPATETNTPQATATNTSVPTATNTTVAPTSTNTPAGTTTAAATRTAAVTRTAVVTRTVQATKTVQATATPKPDFCWTVGQKLSTLIQVLKRLGSDEGDRKYKAEYDLDHDGDIDWRDVEIIFKDIPTCKIRRGHHWWW